MQTITVKTSELLTILRRNRETHSAVSAAAHKKFITDATQQLEALIKKAKETGEVDQVIQFEPPSNHTREYDLAIAMLEMSTENIVTITSREFGSYVQNEWDWSREWAFSNSKYIDHPAVSRFAK